MDFQVEVEVHTQLERGFRLKVSIIGLGMYFNGFRALPPKEGKGWALYPPQTRNPRNGQFINQVEFDKSQVLWKDIYQKSIKAVNSFMGEDDGLDLNAEDFNRQLGDSIDDLNDASEPPIQTIPWMGDPEG